MMQVVAEDERGEQEVEAEHRLQPRGHRAVEHILVRRPRDPEECHRQPRAEHIVEIPERAFECCIMCKREKLCHAYQFPEEEHGDDEEDGTPRAVVQNTVQDRRPPEHRDDERAGEDRMALVRLRGRKERALQHFCMVVCVCRTKPQQEIRRNHVRGGGLLCDRRIARLRQFCGELRREGEGTAREQPLCKGNRPVLRLDDAQACAAPDEAIRLMGKEHIDIARAPAAKDPPHAPMYRVEAQASRRLHAGEPVESCLCIRIHLSCEHQEEDLAFGRVVG